MASKQDILDQIDSALHAAHTVRFWVYKNTWKTPYRRGQAIGWVLVPPKFHTGHVISGMVSARVLPAGTTANDVGLREMQGGRSWLVAHPCRRGYGSFNVTKDECPKATVYYLVLHDDDALAE